MSEDTSPIGDLIALLNGTVLNTHSPVACEGQRCCIHNPSDHRMRSWPQVWRSDRGLMERQCPHGVGHPDPDDIAYKRSQFGSRFAYYEGVHGCDGCCVGDGPTKEAA